jgi:hypothetical protein
MLSPLEVKFGSDVVEEVKPRNCPVILPSSSPLFLRLHPRSHLHHMCWLEVCNGGVWKQRGVLNDSGFRHDFRLCVACIWVVLESTVVVVDAGLSVTARQGASTSVIEPSLLLHAKLDGESWRKWVFCAVAEIFSSPTSARGLVNVVVVCVSFCIKLVTSKKSLLCVSDMSRTVLTLFALKVLAGLSGAYGPVRRTNHGIRASILPL